MKGQRGRGPRPAGLAAALIGLFLIAGTSAARAADDLPKFWKACPVGSEAGECNIPRGVATDPDNGDLYVADQDNNRIVVLDVWGQFVRAWGWGVRDGAPELQVCDMASGCRAGTAGEGAGQLGTPQGVAVGTDGAVYVVDKQNHRVQKFDRAGHFLLMFGGGVNQSSGGDLCPRPGFPTDSCGAGTVGTAAGQFGDWAFSSYIASAPSGEIYVGDENRIQVFNADGLFQRQIPLPEPGRVGALAVDPKSGDLYFSYASEVIESEFTGEAQQPDVYRLDPITGDVLDTLKVGVPTALATDTAGNVFVFDRKGRPDPTFPGNHITRVLEFGPGGDPLGPVAENDDPFEDNEFSTSTGIATGSACFEAGHIALYVSSFMLGGESFVRAYGPAPDRRDSEGELVCPPPVREPQISDQWASSVEAGGAVVKAEINPRFWADTRYYVEYGTGKCSEGGCPNTRPAPPGSLLTTRVADEDLPTAGVSLSGLAPATTYYYRFVATSSGGGPVFGSDRSFTTQALPSAPNTGCANQRFRTGASAGLPDCRAYELVSPLDKEGGDIEVRFNALRFRTRMDQSSLSGDQLTYSSYRSFGGAASAPFSVQYVARRSADAGWQNEPISPPQEGATFIVLASLDNPFKAFSPDLGTGWLLTDTEPVLGPGGQPGVPNIYRRDNSTGAYRACTATEPQFPIDTSHGLKPPVELQGFSADGELAVFRDRNKYTADASEQEDQANAEPINQLYTCSFATAGAAQVRLLSVLPNGKASNLENTLGGPTNDGLAGDSLGRLSTLANAVSADGTRAFWTAGQSSGSPGVLYLRLNPAGEPSASGTCSDVEGDQACTLRIAPSPARFWTAARDGSVAIYGKGASGREDLFEYRVESEESHLIAHRFAGVVGASEDARRIYFVSEEAFDGAPADRPNLYFYERAADGSDPTYTFVATLSARDAKRDASAVADFSSPVNPLPVRHTALVTADASTLSFMSDSRALSEAVAGYDNTDQVSGEPDEEIYRYTLGGGLACVSCNPTGARPSGRRVIPDGHAGGAARWIAADLPTWENSLYAVNSLSADGTRIFFESFEPLVSADTNGKGDVYEWEQAGIGDCDTGDSGYVEASGGCLSLISSGKSPSDTEFVDASPSGRDVFIRTAASLLPWDPGSIDIYDARVDGGFPPPPSPAAVCEGEGCQAPPQPPNDPTPASTVFDAGKASKQRCPKGKVRKHRRCVKKRHGKHGQRHGKQGRSPGGGRTGHQRGDSK
jgi:DNA-binding beta-propeller fold protein YncE